MAQRVEIATVTCPVNITQANAIETPIVFRVGIVRAIRIVIPPGHAGLTGIALAQAHQIIIPSAGSQWVIGDNRDPRFPLENYLDAPNWSAFTYNLDTAYQHSWHLEIEVDEIEYNPSAGGTPIAVPDIYSASAALSTAP